MNNDGPKNKGVVTNHESIEEIPTEITVVRPCHHPRFTSAASAEEDAESELDILTSILDKSTGSDKDLARHRRMVDSKRDGERSCHHPV